MIEINLMSGRQVLPFPWGIFRIHNNTEFCDIIPAKQSSFYFVWRVSAGPVVYSLKVSIATWWACPIYKHHRNLILVQIQSQKFTVHFGEHHALVWVGQLCHDPGRQLQFLISPFKGPILTSGWHRTLGVLAVQPSLWPYTAWKQVPLGWQRKLSIPLSAPVFSLCLHLLQLLSKQPSVLLCFHLSVVYCPLKVVTSLPTDMGRLSPVLFKIHLVFEFWADQIIAFVFSADEVLPHPHAFCKNHTS